MLPVRWLIVFGLAFVTEVLALPTPYITRERNGTTEGSPKDGTLLVPSKESTAEKLARLSQCLLEAGIPDPYIRNPRKTGRWGEINPHVSHHCEPHWSISRRSSFRRVRTPPMDP